MTAKPHLNRWTPELGPTEMRQITAILEALNAAEHAGAYNGDVSLNLAGVLEVSVDDMGGKQTHVGIVQAVDMAAWVFTPGDTEQRAFYGAWEFLRWPEETMLAVIEAARAAAAAPKSDVTRREALREALDALDKSTYVLCPSKQHVVRNDHREDGEDCDRRCTNTGDRERGSDQGERSGREAAQVPG